jgi:Fe-S-cluster-containing dehydrogenase component
MDRRDALIKSTAIFSSLLLAGEGHTSSEPKSNNSQMSVLVDTTKCIGCRKCEWGCNLQNHNSSQPEETYEDKTVFQTRRFPAAKQFTVVNEFPGDGADVDQKPVYIKSQCMHCVDPACASSCIVSALKKDEEGAVTYDADKCMGCRYCMVACPFQANAYEYDNALTPKVRKCNFCLERFQADNTPPACVEACPMQCLTFGHRDQVLAMAHEKIDNNPDVYINHVYGEFEVGGTSWVYVANKPFENLGFPSLSNMAPPRLTESIQHGVFRMFIPPAAMFLLLAGVMQLAKPELQPVLQEGKKR